MQDYKDRVYGCWTGKCLGGAIGMAYEGVPYQPQLTEEDIVVQDVPNDDLELQLVWLMGLRKYGLSLDHKAFGKIWLEHIPHGVDEYPWRPQSERGTCLRQAAGKTTSLQTAGAAIRSEIWAGSLRRASGRGRLLRLA